jgi:hypothetical protein
VTRKRLSRPAVVAGAVLVALVAFGVTAGGGRGAGLSLGRFAGYVWRGSVTSVAASWTVPAIAPASHPGQAGTWIGAEGPSPAGRYPFIQVGTNEERIAGAGGGLRYYAFWSDPVRGFHPQFLFTVAPGDRIAARLAQIADEGLWAVTIADRRSGRRASFLTTEDARQTFNQAEWLQEDITEARTGAAFPYPSLSPVRFTGVAVDGAAPTGGDLYSQWMSAGSATVAPTALRVGAFTLRAAPAPRPIGRRYLVIAHTVQTAQERFDGALVHWTAATPRPVIHRATSRFAAATRADAAALAGLGWPAGAHPLAVRAIAAVRAVDAALGTGPPPTAAGMAAWTAAYEHRAEWAGDAAHALAGRLAVPEFVPVVPIAPLRVTPAADATAAALAPGERPVIAAICRGAETDADRRIAFTLADRGPEAVGESGMIAARDAAQHVGSEATAIAQAVSPLPAAAAYLAGDLRVEAQTLSQTVGQLDLPGVQTGMLVTLHQRVTDARAGGVPGCAGVDPGATLPAAP